MIVPNVYRKLLREMWPSVCSYSNTQFGIFEIVRCRGICLEKNSAFGLFLADRRDATRVI